MPPFLPPLCCSVESLVPAPLLVAALSIVACLPAGLVDLGALSSYSFRSTLTSCRCLLLDGGGTFSTGLPAPPTVTLSGVTLWCGVRWV